MRVAITGSGGFIGSTLTNRLYTLGHEVVEIDRVNNIDLSDWNSVKSILRCDKLIHLAARTFVPDSFDNPRKFYQDNINLTTNAMELARVWKAKVIYMSSYFYGSPQYVPVDEKHPIAPHNPYAQTKYLSEEICKAYNRDFDVPAIAFRLFNIYGPGQKGNFLIPEILGKIKNESKILLKDPRPKRDYIHIDDVVSAIIKGLDYEGIDFKTYNLGTGKSVSVEELVKTLQSKSPNPFEVEFTNEYRKGEVLDSVADTTLINKELGWRPQISLEKGVQSLF